MTLSCDDRQSCLFITTIAFKNCICISDCALQFLFRPELMNLATDYLKKTFVSWSTTKTPPHCQSEMVHGSFHYDWRGSVQHKYRVMFQTEIHWLNWAYEMDLSMLLCKATSTQTSCIIITLYWFCMFLYFTTSCSCCHIPYNYFTSNISRS